MGSHPHRTDYHLLEKPFNTQRLGTVCLIGEYHHLNEESLYYIASWNLMLYCLEWGAYRQQASRREAKPKGNALQANSPTDKFCFVWKGSLKGSLSIITWTTGKSHHLGWGVSNVLTPSWCGSVTQSQALFRKYGWQPASQPAPLPAVSQHS